MHRTNWRSASRAAAVVLAATAAYGVSTAVAQTGTPAQATTPAATTPAATTPTDTSRTTTGPDLGGLGTDNTPSPGTNTCVTKLFKPKADGVPEEMKSADDIVLQYRIRCSSPMSAYTLAFNRQVDGIQAEILVTALKDNSPTKDQSFNCGGDTPGFGVNCVGTYKGGYNTIRGLVAFALTPKEQKAGAGLCKLGLKGTISTFYSDFTRDAFTGAIKLTNGATTITNYASGPYKTKTGC